MTPEKHGRGVEQAWQALEVWASVGVCRFDLTQTDLDGHKRSFQPALTLQVLRRCLPAWIESSIRRRQNFIVRPRGAMLVQLDDLRGPVLERLKGCAFLMLATSPGNHQAWIALQDYSPDFARNLRRGSGADPSASGATRLPDSINYKRKYAPDFPTVRLLQAVPCRIATRLELESLGLLADVDTMRLKSPARASSGRGTKRWPSYERCLAGAPKTHCGNGPDVSRADFTFCLISLDWGWSFEDAVGRLLEMSSKARENGERYARLTVARAATALHQRS